MAKKVYKGSYYENYHQESFTDATEDMSGGTDFPLFDDAFQILKTALSPWDTLKGIWNDVIGRSAQNREFAQQEYLSDKQWEERDSPQAQMENMKAAGINPLLAAQGIAGGNSSAAPPAVSNATGAAASGLGALSGAVGQVGSLAQAASNINEQMAHAGQMRAETKALDQRVRNETMDVAGRLITSIMSAGFPEMGAAMIGLDIANGGPEAMLNFLKAQDGARQFDIIQRKLKAERDIAIDQADTMLDQITASMSLQDAQAIREKAAADKLDAETTYQNKLNEVQKSNPVYNLPYFNQLVYWGREKGFDSVEYNNIGQTVYKGEYWKSLGSFDADTNTAYYRAYNAALGDSEIAPYLKSLENAQYLFKLLADLRYSAEGNFDDILYRIIGNLNRYMDEQGTSPNPRIPEKIGDSHLQPKEVSRSNN